MKEPLKIQVTGKDHMVVRLIGPISETSDLSTVRLPPHMPVELDLAGVTSINSVGIRIFRDWATKVSNATFHISYAPKVIIDQLNMITGMLPKQARVISFYVPYFSEESGEERNVLYLTGEHYRLVNGDVSVDDLVVKDSKGGLMEMDAMPERYFRFLKTYF